MIVARLAVGGRMNVLHSRSCRYQTSKDNKPMPTARKEAKKPAKKAVKKRKLEVSERPHPNLRTTEEAAELLSLENPASVRHLIRKGRLEGRLVGRVLWITLGSIERYNEKRRPRGRPEGTITGESQNKRGMRETEYQRDYKRRVRKGLIKPSRKRGGAKKGGSADAPGGKGAKRAS
jgi:hypothetical protein